MTETFVDENTHLIEDYFGFESHWLSTREGEQIHYLDEGPEDGIPVIQLHGSAIGITGAANFYLQIPALSQAGFRSLVPDLYGYGFTIAPPGVAGDRADQIDLVRRFMEGLGIETAYFIGNSLGGFLVSDLAIDAPELLRGGIIVGRGGATWPAGPRFASNLRMGDNKPAFEPDMVRRAMVHLVLDPATVTEALVEFRTKMAELPGAYDKYLEAVRQREVSKERFPWRPEAAAKSPVPMLFVFGQDDSVNPPEDALAGMEAFQHADLVVFGHCGHWTMIERADDFNDLAIRFLSGYDRHIESPPRRSQDLGGPLGRA